MDVVTRTVKFCINDRELKDVQRQKFESWAGFSRSVFNWALGLRNEYEDNIRAESIKIAGSEEALKALTKTERIEVRKKAELVYGPASNFSNFSLSNRFTADIKDPEHRFHWHHLEGSKKVNPRAVLNSALSDYNKAVKMFYSKKINGTSKAKKPRKDGRPNDWPRFKRWSDKNKDGFAISGLSAIKQERIVEGKYRIFLPLIGSLRVCNDTKILRRMIARGGVTKTAMYTRRGDRWYVSITVSMPVSTDFAVKSIDKTKTSQAGVDLGVNRLATLSDATDFENKRFLKKREERLKTLQRSFKGMSGPDYKNGVIGSSRYNKRKAQITKLHHKIALNRESNLHLISKSLVRKYSLLSLEDLNVSNMTAKAKPKEDPENPGQYLKNNKAAKSGLNRSILDVGFYELRRQIEYKSVWWNTKAIFVNPAYTSKTCSSCLHINTSSLEEYRVFVCESCSYTEDRDINAAKNILARGLTKLNE